MERIIDSDYIDFSHISGFNMGIDFDGFEENLKKFMELPIKYLDSAHDKAVEFIEDVHAILYAPSTDDNVPDKEDESSNRIIAQSSPKSVGTELVGANGEASTPPASLIAVENNSDGCVDTDAHRTESFSTKNISEEVTLWNPETCIKPPLPRLTTIPQDDHAPSALETDEVIEQAGLRSSGHSDSSVYSGVIPHGNSSANYEEQMILCSANDQQARVTLQDSTAISQDDYAPQALHSEQGIEQGGLDCSGYSDTLVSSAKFFNALLLEDSNANYEKQNVSYSANVPVEAAKHDIDLMDGWESMANYTNVEEFSIPERRNASFKKMFMTNLSRKLRWAKKQANAHKAVPSGLQDPKNIVYQLVSSVA